MECLVQPNRLRTRIQMWAEEEIGVGALPANSGRVSGRFCFVANFREEMRAVRSASATRRVVAALVARGVLESDGPRATVRLAFPAALVPR